MIAKLLLTVYETVTPSHVLKNIVVANIVEQQINEILQQRSYLHIERSLLRHTFKRHEPFLGVKY